MKTKAVLLILCLFLYSTINAQQPASAETILKEAYKQAATQKKNVFVLFHASWCGWCHKMDTAMNDPKVKKLFTDNYVIEHLVVYESKSKKQLENPGAEDLLKKHYGNDKGIPYWLVFDAKGNLLADSKERAENGGPETGDNVGCPASEKEVAYFINVLKKTSSLKEEQLSIIAKRFRENEH
ncbi:MAG TPA: thioredoxin family protein [Chitinophagaceae bacterium]